MSGHFFFKLLILSLFCSVVPLQGLHAEDVIWRNRPMSTTSFPVPDVVKTGPGPGGGVMFERRYLLARVLVDADNGNAGTVDTITTFFVDDALVDFDALPDFDPKTMTLPGLVRLNVFTTAGPELPTPQDNPDDGLLLPATFTQNKTEGWIEVTVTGLANIPGVEPVFVNLGVPYFIGITPVFVEGSEPFGGFHLANALGKGQGNSEESQSAYRETNPMPIDWFFAGDLFGPPAQLFASIEILRQQPLCSPGQQSLSQNFDETTITPMNSVSCNGGGIHTSNSYYRSFSLSGTTGDFKIGSVCLGIELANGFGAGDIPVDVNFYWNTPINGVIHNPLGSTLQDASISTTIPGNGSVDLSIVDIPVAGVVVPDFATNLVVEIFTPGSDGPNPLGQSLFVGSNPNGQSAPTYLAAAACGINNPTPTGNLGFPNMHMVLIIKPCESAGCGFSAGDVNQDGVVGLSDVAPFLATLINGPYLCEADINNDGAVTLLDVEPFVAILTGGG